MSLPPEKIKELQKLIQSRLSQANIHDRIKEVFNDSVNTGTMDPEDVHEEDFIKALREKRIVDEVMRQINFQDVDSEDKTPGAPKTLPPSSAPLGQYSGSRAQRITSAIDPSRRYLFLQVLGGKAFLEHLQEDAPLPGQIAPYFTLHVSFRGQRFQSRPTPCAVEPDMQEGFLLKLHKESSGAGNRMADATTVLSINDPVHLVLTKTSPNGECSLVSSLFLEWRAVLSAPNSRCTMSAEMKGIGSKENHATVGLLEIKLEILPTLPQTISDDVIQAQRTLEKNRQGDSERLFLVYAKQWWKEYLQIRPEHKQRLVKIFAEDENRNNRPICSFLFPMRSGRLLETPRLAARFVSVIPYEKTLTIGGGEDKGEQWTSMHAFLARNKGDCEDHAVLLCSLLLGFGLDAYVCVGTKGKGSAHCWVMTINHVATGNQTVTFWESLNAERFNHQPIDFEEGPMNRPKRTYPYKSVGCVFNHANFYANCQASDDVLLCHFDLDNNSHWKAMSTDAINSVLSGNVAVSRPILCPNSIDCADAANNMELQLRLLVSQHRHDQGLSTTWDDHLSYITSMALAGYETQKRTGLGNVGSEEFAQAVSRALPDGHTFQAFPVEVSHLVARRAFVEAMQHKNDTCRSVINCRGEKVRHSIRVHVYAYPENAVAVWLMIGCSFNKIN